MPATPTHRCPACGATQVRGGKTTFPEASLREYGCMSCGLYEERRSDDADFATWLDSWRYEPPESLCTLGRGALYARIVQRPLDDAARLAYADLIAGDESERAEFIRLQIARFNDDVAQGVLSNYPMGREGQLLERHGLDWGRFIEPYARPIIHPPPRPKHEKLWPGYDFERGFVARLRIDAVTWAAKSDEILALAPIEHLILTGPGPFIPALQVPGLAQMRSLDLGLLGLGDEEAIVLAGRKDLQRLKWLNLHYNRISTPGLDALLANYQIRKLPIVILRNNPADPTIFCDYEYNRYTPAEMSSHGLAAERRYGRIDWIHVTPDITPDYAHAGSARIDYHP